jgi:hypothetical protein
MPEFNTRKPQRPNEPNKLRSPVIASKLRSLVIATRLRALLIGGGILLFVVVAVPVGLLLYSFGAHPEQVTPTPANPSNVGRSPEKASPRAYTDPDFVGPYDSSANQISCEPGHVVPPGSPGDADGDGCVPSASSSASSSVAAFEAQKAGSSSASASASTLEMQNAAARAERDRNRAAVSTAILAAFLAASAASFLWWLRRS